MTCITGVEQYITLTTNSDRQDRRKNINCYLMAEELERIISEGRLFYRKNTAGYVFFVDKGHYYQMSLYIDPAISFFVDKKDKPIISEFLGNSAMPEKSRAAADILLNNGFSHSVTTSRMVLTIDESPESHAEETEYRAAYASVRNAEEIMAVWQTAFDPVVNLLPSREELDVLIQNRNIICAADNRGTIVAALQINYKKSGAWSWHVAVHPEYRGKGIGNILSRMYLSGGIESGINKYFLWVDQQNLSAINFHSKFGYKLENRFCEQYIQR